MGKFDFLNSMVDHKDNTTIVKHGRVSVKKPNTLFNLFKRLLSLSIGLTFLFILYKALEQDPEINLDKMISTVANLCLCGVFIYYGIFRSKIHKEIFIQFDKDRIYGRLYAPIDEYDQSRVLMFKMMVAPKFLEFDYRFDEIERIKIEINKIVIFFPNKMEQTLDLSNMEYKILKTLKSEFAKINQKLSVAL